MAYNFTSSPLNYPQGSNTPIKRIKQNRAPTTGDNQNFAPGDEWLDTAGNDWWKLVKVTQGVALWVKIGNNTGNPETLTGNSGGAVGPDANANINVVGDATTINIAGNPGTNTLTASVVGGIRYPVTPYVVGPVGQAGYQTIQSAINAANAAGGGVVFIQKGTYTENLILAANVNLTAFGCDGVAPAQGSNITNNVIIQGTLTVTYTGVCAISGIQLRTNGAAVIATSGSNISALTLTDCSIYALDATGMTFNNSSNTCNFFTCVFRSASTNVLFAATAVGGLDFENCTFNLSASGNPCTIALGRAVFQACDMQGVYFSTSNVGGVLVNACYWQFGGQTLLTTAGTGTSEVFQSYLNSTTASTVSVGTGTTVNMSNCQILSSNTNAITGLGTLNYSSLSFLSSSSTINTSSQNTYAERTGALTSPSISFDAGVNLLNRYISTTPFTPGLAFGGGSTGITYTVQQGIYSVIGNMLFFSIYIDLSNKGSSTGNVTITGLPFDVGNISSQVSFCQLDLVTYTAGYSAPFLRPLTGSTKTAEIWQSGDGVIGINLDDTNFDTSSNVRCQGFYFL